MPGLMRPTMARASSGADEMHRPGVTLVELLGAIAVTTVLLAVAIAVMTVMLRADRSLAGTTATQLELDRLGEQFRRDAHQAIGLQVDDAGRTWSFALPNGGRVAY